MSLSDTLGRPLRDLRISVTDRCNLRCEYCMPEEEYSWLPREDILRFEEVSTLVDAFIGAGVEKVRLTGGEPLLRRDLPSLVAMLAAKPALRDLAMTSNAMLLGEQAAPLKAAGLQRLNISLDTLDPARFARLTRFDRLPQVLEGIQEARRHFSGFKLDTVVMRGVNDEELCSLIEYAKTIPAELRFIEYMDVGGATLWSADRVVPRREILETIETRYGRATPLVEDDPSAPADRYALPDGTIFGVISSTTQPFCRTCDRGRLTADGLFYLCLYGVEAEDLRGALRGGATREEIQALVARRWIARADRGAEMRLEQADRRAFVPISALRADPHLEMHKRGG
jgi:cyclic pyranopterin phosphate synthase